MNIFEILQMRKSRPPSVRASKDNPLVNMLVQPQSQFPSNHLEVPSQFGQYNQSNNQHNQANQFENVYFNPFNHLNNRLL